MRYRCNDGDRLDSICQQHYGHLNGSVEAVLAANPGLADRTTAVFNSGEVITLPTIQAPEQSVKQSIRLWD
jgi:phage tail protein X